MTDPKAEAERIVEDMKVKVTELWVRPEVIGCVNYPLLRETIESSLLRIQQETLEECAEVVAEVAKGFREKESVVPYSEVPMWRASAITLEATAQKLRGMK